MRLKSEIAISVSVVKTTVTVQNVNGDLKRKSPIAISARVENKCQTNLSRAILIRIDQPKAERDNPVLQP